MTFRDQNRSHYLRRNRHRPVTVKRIKEQPKIVPVGERALVATSEQEYKRLIRDFPLRRIILDITYQQETLFNTREFIDV